jgi:nitrite reductase/ring-hydroxylating ferredoxin subunit
MRRSAGQRSIGRGGSEDVRSSLNNASVVTPLIELARLADGAFAEVEANLDGDAESLILYRTGDAVRAWLNICPHAGRRLDWAPGQFLKSKDGLLVCAAHGASFELNQGECLAGPCRGETLRAVAVVVRDDAVWLVEQGVGIRD